MLTVRIYPTLNHCEAGMSTYRLVPFLQRNRWVLGIYLGAGMALFWNRPCAAYFTQLTSKVYHQVSMFLLCSEPIYPPSHISFELGPTPHKLYPVAGQHEVQATDQRQWFVLPANAPVGRYLRVILHGKQQTQLDDMQYYLAIR